MIAQLRADERLSKSKAVQAGLDGLQLILQYCQLFGLNKVVFDMSLARGLDYYTGVIYEAVLLGMYLSLTFVYVYHKLVRCYGNSLRKRILEG